MTEEKYDLLVRLFNDTKNISYIEQILDAFKKEEIEIRKSYYKVYLANKKFIDKSKDIDLDKMLELKELKEEFDVYENELFLVINQIEDVLEKKYIKNFYQIKSNLDLLKSLKNSAKEQ